LGEGGEGIGRGDGWELDMGYISRVGG